MKDIITLEYRDIFDNNKTKELVFSKHLLKSKYNEKSLFALLVDGKSMQPEINDRDVIVADLSEKELIDEGIYVLYYEEKMWIKKYRSSVKKFVSINPDFSHLIYKKDEVYIVAKVLLTCSNL